MHALTIRFTVPDTADWDAIRARFRARAPLYAEMPALLAKAFIVNPETGVCGANYVWKTEADADKFLSSEFWTQTVQAMGFGQPRIERDEVAAYVERDSVVLPPVD